MSFDKFSHLSKHELQIGCGFLSLLLYWEVSLHRSCMVDDPQGRFGTSWYSRRDYIILVYEEIHPIPSLIHWSNELTSSWYITPCHSFIFLVLIFILHLSFLLLLFLLVSHLHLLIFLFFCLPILMFFLAVAHSTLSNRRTDSFFFTHDKVSHETTRSI